MKLVIVGGVAGGASLAARARRLDEHAEIVVFEKGEHISFANCGLPYHIGEVIAERDRLLLQTPQSLKDSLNLDVRIGTEVIAINRKNRTITARDVHTGKTTTESYDYLGLATGAEAVVPPTPGIDLPHIHVLRDIQDMDAIKARVDHVLDGREPQAGKAKALVIGAGYIGLEMAENFHHRGMDVAVVELSDQILPPLDKEMSVPVERYLRGMGVALHLGTQVAAFRQKDARISAELAEHTVLDVDIVILAIGVKPNNHLAKDAGLKLGERGGVVVDTHMRTSDRRIFAVGDVVQTPHTVLPGSYLAPLAGPANRQARVAAENICGRDTEYRSTQGTSIVKVFDMAAGGTGATEKQLKATGVNYRVVHVHPSGHAGYYPGTAMMHMKLLFSPDDGRVLGGQVVGFDGIDKRLDVLAAAVRAGLTVYDLEEFELAYAPPFGSAKDPINMAGFVASNVLQGDLVLWRAEDYPDATAGARLIDVRTPEEFGIWHIPGAENVPLPTLRDASEGWDQSTPIRLYCAVGFRSYLAQRALVQRGFTDVATLSGGSHTFRFFHELEPDDTASMPAILSYAERESITTSTPEPSGTRVNLDCTGLACPGPVMRLQETMSGLSMGDEVEVVVTDPGFGSDGPAWAKRNGHQVISIDRAGPGYTAVFRKGGAGALATAGVGGVSSSGKPKTSFVVFSGDLDKQIAAFIIANGALSMGEDVSMFFTFWGLNALRKHNPPKRQKKLMDKMFGAMMPSDANHLSLSQMNMMGAGTAMIKGVMKQHGVPSLPELMRSAMFAGAEIVACNMTMDLLGIAESDLIDGVRFGGVATFLGEAAESHNTLFI